MYLNISWTKLIFYIDKADITVVEMAPAKIHLNLINPINPVPYQDLREFKFSIRLFNWSSNSNMGSGNFFVTSCFEEASSEPSWWWSGFPKWPFSFLCRERWPRCLNVLPHWSQRNPFSLLWTNRCRSRWILFLNTFSHRMQLCFLHLCFLRWHFWLKFLWHCSQVKGFTFEWTNMCLFKLEASWKCFLHWSQ